MRRSASTKLACSAAGAHTVTANPIRLPSAATATATGDDPQTTISGCGRIGSTNTSIVPWLGHMFSAKRTPARSSPAGMPCSCSASGGCTETSRGLPSASASRAALSTAARAQPPPIQPSEMVPSGRITAFAPALAAVAATVRTTVASANGWPAALRSEMVSRMSLAWSIVSDPREVRFERGEALEVVGGSEQIDMRQRRLHAACFGAKALPADKRVEPDDPPASLPQAPHLGGEPLGLAGVVAVRHDHDRGARIDHAPRMPAIERRQALADAGAAADALRHQPQAVDRARDVAVAQRRRHMRQPGMEDEGLRLAECIDDAM